MNAQSDGVGCSLVLGNRSLRFAFAALHGELVFVILPESNSEYHSGEKLFICSIMLYLLGVCPLVKV